MAKLIMFHTLMESDGIFAQSSPYHCLKSILSLNPHYINHEQERNIQNCLVLY